MAPAHPICRREESTIMVDFEDAPPAIGRRSVLRAGAWAAPVLVLATAAPAAAASVAPTGTLVFNNLTRYWRLRHWRRGRGAGEHKREVRLGDRHDPVDLARSRHRERGRSVSRRRCTRYSFSAARNGRRRASAKQSRMQVGPGSGTCSRGRDRSHPMPRPRSSRRPYRSPSLSRTRPRPVAGSSSLRRMGWSPRPAKARARHS